MKMIDISYVEKVERIQKLNQCLFDVLTKTACELIQYAKENGIELPYKIHPLFEEINLIISELKRPSVINKSCSVCTKLNPENAEYCCYCGSSLIIARVSPDLLRPKNKDSKSPDKRQNLASGFCNIIG
jgi:hypothetical protein